MLSREERLIFKNWQKEIREVSMVDVEGVGLG
jgi:hypothetical protein